MRRGHALRGLWILCARELQLIARQQALVIAMLAYTAVLGAFVLSWSQGPVANVFPGRSFYDGVRLFQLPLLGAVLPWTAARVSPARPSRLVAARFVAVFIALGLVASASFPVMIAAGRMSAVEPTRTLLDEVGVQVLAALSAAVLLGWRHLCSHRLISWLGATISTLAIAAAARVEFPPSTAAAALAAVAAALVFALSVRTNRAVLHTAEIGR